MSGLAESIRNIRNTTCSAVVVAAGSSVRMGEDKLFMKLGGMPVLARTLLALHACACVDEIVVVTRAESLEQVAGLCRDYGVLKVSKIVCGGATRTESALAGLSEIRRGAHIAIIHDGDRPLVTEKIVWDAVHAAELYKAAAPAVPVTDTVKLRENNTVARTLPREELAAVQTPQAFRPELIKAALTRAVLSGVSYTDDCAAAEALGIPVRLTDGSRDNIKITVPADLELAESILRRREVQA